MKTVPTFPFSGILPKCNCHCLKKSPQHSCHNHHTKLNHITGMKQLQFVLSTFLLKIQTTTLQLRSTGIYNPSRIFWPNSTITSIQIPLSAITSSDMSEIPMGFSSFHFCWCPHHLISTYTVYWNFYCISFHIMIQTIFLIYNYFHLVFQNSTSLRPTEAQLPISTYYTCYASNLSTTNLNALTSSHTPFGRSLNSVSSSSAFSLIAFEIPFLALFSVHLHLTLFTPVIFLHIMLCASSLPHSPHH